jgi:hypothetical protein
LPILWFNKDCIFTQPRPEAIAIRCLMCDAIASRHDLDLVVFAALFIKTVPPAVFMILVYTKSKEQG